MFKLTREVGKTNLKKFLTKRNGCDRIKKAVAQKARTTTNLDN